MVRSWTRGGRRERLLGPVVGLVVALALVLPEVLPAAATTPRPQVDVGATVLVLSPLVETSVGGAPFEITPDGQTLTVGDEAQSAPVASALLTFFDGSEVQLGESSRLRIEAPTGGGGGNTLVQAAGVTVQRIARAATGAGAQHQTDTPTATILVRGTTFSVGVRRFADVQSALLPRFVSFSEDLLLAEEAAVDPNTGSLIWTFTWLDGAGEVYQTAEDLGPFELTDSALYEENGNIWRRRSWLDPATGDRWSVYDNLGPEDQENGEPLNPCGEADPLCVAAAILLPDPDGHVGQLELAPFAALPPVTLGNTCEVAGASVDGRLQAALTPESCADILASTADLTDPAAAQVTDRVVRDVLREVAVALGVPAAPAAPGAAIRLGQVQTVRVGQTPPTATPTPTPTATPTPSGGVIGGGGGPATATPTATATPIPLPTLVAGVCGGTFPSTGVVPGQTSYSVADNTQPGGPSYNWIEVSGSGSGVSALQSVDDVCAGPLRLPFNFPFFGQSFDHVFINANGMLSFVTGSSSYSNVPLPNTSSPNLFIAPFWDDIDSRCRTDDGIFYQTVDAGQGVVIQWQNWDHYSCSGAGVARYTFEAILYSNGTIVFQYRNMDLSRASASIGIENQDGSRGAAYTGTPSSGRAIRFTPS